MGQTGKGEEDQAGSLCQSKMYIDNSTSKFCYYGKKKCIMAS